MKNNKSIAPRIEHNVVDLYSFDDNIVNKNLLGSISIIYIKHPYMKSHKIFDSNNRVTGSCSDRE